MKEFNHDVKDESQDQFRQFARTIVEGKLQIDESLRENEKIGTKNRANNDSKRSTILSPLSILSPKSPTPAPDQKPKEYLKMMITKNLVSNLIRKA